MRRNRTFWGFLLVILGSLLFLQTTGILKFEVWNLFFPIFIILVGGWMILRSSNRRHSIQEEVLALPRENFERVEMEIKHGAGRINMKESLSEDFVLQGRFSGGVQHRIEKNQTLASIFIEPPSDWIDAVPFGSSSNGFNWQFELNPSIQYKLSFKTGAGESRLDFTKLQISDIKLETGASSTTVKLPENAGFTNVMIKAGAASVEVDVPDQVVAQIKIESGLSGININTNRFKNLGNGSYQSDGYEQAANKIKIFIEGGLGSFQIN